MTRYPLSAEEQRAYDEARELTDTALQAFKHGGSPKVEISFAVMSLLLQAIENATETKP